MEEIQTENSLKYSFIGSIIVAIIMVAIGYYLIKVTNEDKSTHKCDADWYLKVIGWIIIIGNFITFCVSSYMLYNLQ